MKINSFTHVHDPERGSVELAPGEVPEWAESLITNPGLIVVEPDEDAADSDDDSDEDSDGDQSDDDDTETVEIPKKRASATKWAEYALTKGFEVEADATAASIREALEAEGIPTE